MAATRGAFVDLAVVSTDQSGGHVDLIRFADKNTVTGLGSDVEKGGKSWVVATSNVFYFHPETWGSTWTHFDLTCAYFVKGVGENPPARK